MNRAQKKAIDLHKNVPPDWYESSVKTNVLQWYWHRRREQKIKQFSSPVKGTVLDIGSADGYFSNIILHATQANKLIGIDVLSASVKYARNRYKHDKRFQFEVADALKLPYKNNSFSAVFSIESLEHLLEPEKAIAEMYRVLKKHGYAIVLIPTENLLFKIIWFFWTKGKGKIWSESHVHLFQPHDLQKLMKKAGFKKSSQDYFLGNMLLILKAYK